ncbi:MAG TPA: hypothetical protein VKD72_15740, partial [Gemmataceae bacterium]|nr:hypothetical protein [Gemmataceae bacterium]
GGSRIGRPPRPSPEGAYALKGWREVGDLPFPNYRPERIVEFQNRLEYPSVDSAVARRPSGGRK